MKRFISIFLVFAWSGSFAQSDTWLPAENGDAGTNPSARRADAFLKSLKGSVRFMTCAYEGSKLVQTNVFKDRTLSLPGSTWKCDVTDRHLPGEDAFELLVTFQLLEGMASNTGVAVAFDFSNWSLQNYVLAPAVLYGGNRFRILPVGYPPYIYDSEDRPLDMPITTTNIPHLNADGSHSRVEMLTGNCATPMLSFFNPVEKRSFILLTEQQTGLGNSGMFAEEDMAKKQFSYVVSAPGVREKRYVMCSRTSSGDSGVIWKKGDRVTLKFRLYNVAAKDIPGFYARVFDVRKSLSGQNSYRDFVPFSTAADMILDHHDRTKWFKNDSIAYISYSGMKPIPGGEYSGIQVGWGGEPVCYLPQVIRSTPERINRTSKTLDVLVSLQAKTGLFYAMFHRGKVMGDGFGWGGNNDYLKRPYISMTRRTADMLFSGIKQIQILRRTGYGEVVKDSWISSLRRTSDALLNVWGKYGQLGRTINVETLEMDENGSSAGVAAIGALALAADFFKEKKYLDTAKVIARYYYERDFKKGYSGGGASEILQSPDSETPWDMAESCTILYELTGEKEWLDMALTAVHMLSTWVVSYNYIYPAKSIMARINAHAAGSIFASAQNNHSAPGLYILSGDFLLRLYRATGDKKMAALYKDIIHNVVQYVNTPTNPLIDAGDDGAVSERANLSDWEGKENVGGNIPSDDTNLAWEAVAALACLEDPGIYLRNDNGEILVLDNVEAEVLRHDGKSVTLRIKNSTSYDAHVSLFSENGLQAARALDRYVFLKWPKIEIKAHSTERFVVYDSGKIVKE